MEYKSSEDKQTEDDLNLGWKDTVAFIVAAFSIVLPFVLVALVVFGLLALIGRIFT